MAVPIRLANSTCRGLFLILGFPSCVSRITTSCIRFFIGGHVPQRNPGRHSTRVKVTRPPAGRRGRPVCPPEEILQNTVIVRMHRDDAEESNGPLKIVPGCRNKKLSMGEISLISQSRTPTGSDVNAAGIHIMKPLSFLASSKATSQRHRRVLHPEFNSMELPFGLQWAEPFDTTLQFHRYQFSRLCIIV